MAESPVVVACDNGPTGCSITITQSVEGRTIVLSFCTFSHAGDVTHKVNRYLNGVNNNLKLRPASITVSGHRNNMDIIAPLLSAAFPNRLKL